jgi:hypothetical protein
VLPPDESDASILTGKKKDKLIVKKPLAGTDDDILKDGTPANGFNTGIKKETKTAPVVTGRRNR